MDVIGHNTPTKYSKTFVFYAIIPTVKQDLSLQIPREYIYPINNSKSYKIEI